MADQHRRVPLPYQAATTLPRYGDQRCEANGVACAIKHQHCICGAQRLYSAVARQPGKQQRDAAWQRLGTFETGIERATQCFAGEVVHRIMHQIGQAGRAQSLAQTRCQLLGSTAMQG
ncbi:hypothetical protein D3C75_813730 [compost metagenome]